MTKREILGTKKRVGYRGDYYLIVPDHAAGRRNRFTVYRIPSSPSRRTRILGRELTWAHCMRIAKTDLHTIRAAIRPAFFDPTWESSADPGNLLYE